MNNQSRSSAKIKNPNLINIIFSKLVPCVNWWDITFQFHSHLIFVSISYRLSFTRDIKLQKSLIITIRDIKLRKSGEVRSLLLISIWACFEHKFSTWSFTITHHEPKLKQLSCKDEFDNRCKDTYQGGNGSVDNWNLSKEPLCQQ